MEPFVITLSDKASKSFLKELKANSISFQFQVKTSFYFLESTPKLRMAIKMITERFGKQSFTIKPVQ